MIRWRVFIASFLLLGLVGLVACGGTITTAPPRVLVDSTPIGSTAPRGATAPRFTPTTVPPSTSASARPSAAARATATTTSARPSAPPAATTIPQPRGTIPAGWQVYRGPTNFPIVIAYPPDWTVDTSLFPAQSVIFIYGPNGVEEEEVVEIVAGAQQAEANIDVLRDDFFYRKTAFCDKTGIEYTERRQISDATFAILGATCDQSTVLYFFQVASGLKNADEWSFVMRTPYARKQARLREVFDPMLASLNIYAPIAP